MVFATETCLEAVSVAASGKLANAIVTLALQIIIPLQAGQLEMVINLEPGDHGNH